MVKEAIELYIEGLNDLGEEVPTDEGILVKTIAVQI